jgi:dTMP kinase
MREDKMPRRGRLIAVCGIDGSGKTLQCELLARRAAAAGWRVESIEFPRYESGFFGQLIARYLRGEFAADPSAVDPYLAALPFACDRWEAKPTLVRWLKAGALVVANRYVSANLAHQGSKLEDPARRREFMRWVEEMEYGVFALPRPDLQVWLDMPPEAAVHLIAKKTTRAYLQQGRDIHENSMRHLRGTYEAYRELAASPGWLRIECAAGGRPLEPERIAAAVWDGIRSRFPRDRRFSRDRKTKQ